MFLIVVSAVHVVLKAITPSAKYSIAVSAFLFCIPSVRRTKWHSLHSAFSIAMAVKRLAACSILWVMRNSERESTTIDLCCLISLIMVSTVSVVSLRLINFQAPVPSRGVTSHP